MAALADGSVLGVLLLLELLLEGALVELAGLDGLLLLLDRPALALLLLRYGAEASIVDEVMLIAEATGQRPSSL